MSASADNDHYFRALDGAPSPCLGEEGGPLQWLDQAINAPAQAVPLVSLLEADEVTLRPLPEPAAALAANPRPEPARIDLLP